MTSAPVESEPTKPMSSRRYAPQKDLKTLGEPARRCRLDGLVALHEHAAMRSVSILVLFCTALGACASGRDSGGPIGARDPQSVCLVGRFGAPFDRARVARWLEDRGYVVRDRPDAGLAVALVGNSPVNDTGDGFVDVESTDAYRDAVRCGATIVRITDLTGWPDAWRALGSR